MKNIFGLLLVAVAAGVTRRSNVQGARGHAHSKTLRDEWRNRMRASVLECGCPLPLSYPHLIVMWLALIILGALPLHAENPSDPARVKQIAAMLSPAPSSFGQPITNRAAWNAVDDSSAKSIIALAEKMVTQPDPEISDDLYLDCSRTGNRDRCQKVMFERSARLTTFALAECLENKGRFLKPLQKTIETICAEKAWPYPAHDLPLTVFHGQEMKPDLRATALAFDLGTADYLLGDKLPAATHQLLRENIRKRVLEPFRETVAGKNNQAHWLKIQNNWNAVCLAGTTGAALAIEESPEDRAWFIAAAEHYIENFLRGFGADGYCSEGIGYWNYGFGHFVILTEQIRQATQGKLDLFALPEANLPARFAIRDEIIDHIYPTISDVGPGTQPDPHWLRYVVERLHLPATDLKLDSKIDSRDLGAAALELFAGRTWPVVNTTNSEVKDSPLRTWFYDGAVLIDRPTPGGKPFAVVLKGGNNRENHNHVDKGSFSVVCGGSMVICDPGGEVYTKRTFGPHRYDSGVLNSFGHAVPVVAGKLETTATNAQVGVLRTNFTDNEDTVIFDLRPMYDVADLKKLERTFVYHRGDDPSLRVTDVVLFEKPEQFESALITWGEQWKQISTNEFEIVDDDGKARVTIDTGGLPFTIHKSVIEEDVHTERYPVHIGIVLNQPVKDATVKLVIRPVFGKD